ncbi:MAG: DinB family protein [Anaerolineaceae bacterium]|nr:DinB family protein [Anaerolineaceae bacterium]
MDANNEELIGQVDACQKRMVALFESVADDQDWSPAAGEWSFRFIAAHMATVDKECYEDRVVRIAGGGKPFFQSYFNTGRDFSQLELADWIKEWKSTRKEIIDFVRGLPEAAFAYTGRHEAFGELTVRDVLKLMLDHDGEHIAQLEKIVSECKDGKRVR